MEERFKTKTLEEWTKIFDSLDACVSPVLSLDEAPLYKHNVERDAFIKLKDNKTFLPTMNWISDTMKGREFKMPKIGQNTDTILKEIGYSDAEIVKLIDESVVEKSKTKSKL